MTRAVAHAPAHLGGLRAVSGLLRRLWAGFDRAARLRAQRGALAALDDRMLADIGLSRAQALAECDRPAWDAPGHWRG